MPRAAAKLRHFVRQGCGAQDDAISDILSNLHDFDNSDVGRARRVAALGVPPSALQRLPPFVKKIELFFTTDCFVEAVHTLRSAVRSVCAADGGGSSDDALLTTDDVLACVLFALADVAPRGAATQAEAVREFCYLFESEEQKRCGELT